MGIGNPFASGSASSSVSVGTNDDYLVYTFVTGSSPTAGIQTVLCQGTVVSRSLSSGHDATSGSNGAIEYAGLGTGTWTLEIYPPANLGIKPTTGAVKNPEVDVITVAGTTITDSTSCTYSPASFTTTTSVDCVLASTGKQGATTSQDGVLVGALVTLLALALYMIDERHLL